MLILLSTIIILLSSIGNRLRGTGVLTHIATIRLPSIKYIPSLVNINLCGSHIYGLFIAIVLGVTFSNYLLGLLLFIAYIIGESKGWGEWVGMLTRTEPYDDEVLAFCYKDNEGKTFPFIHQITNSIIKEQVEGSLITRSNQYRKYATLALTLRGLYWWLPMYLVLYYYNITTLLETFTIPMLLGIAFPIACYLSKLTTFTKKIGILSFSQGWENQEIIYGLFQGIALSYILITRV